MNKRVMYGSVIFVDTHFCQEKTEELPLVIDSSTLDLMRPDFLLAARAISGPFSKNSA
jgi:hypothetical protein